MDLMLIKSTVMLKSNKVHGFSGQGLIEYALIVLLIAIVVIAILSTLGLELNNTFQFINESLPQVN